MKNKKELKELFRCNIAGVQYGDYQQCLNVKAGAVLKLLWEKTNLHDNMAIRVDYCGIKLGYIPRGTFQMMLHEYREKGIKVFTTMTSVNPTNHTWYRFVIKCEISKNKQNTVYEF